MTRQEKHLWYDFLKKLPITVNRQKNIGDCIVDFYIDSAKLVIEIDGNHHGYEKFAKEDKLRDEALNMIGLTVVRYSNQQIDRYFDDVCRDLLKRLGLELDDLMK
jgi:very-short-patch-repair endonuclease